MNPNSLENYQKGFWSLINPLNGQQNHSIGTYSQALTVYQNNTLASRIKALKLIFIVIGKVLPKKLFHRLTEQYCRHYAAPSWDLNEMGRRFPGFIHEILETDVILSNYPFLGDLAELELAVNDVTYSPQHTDEMPRYTFGLSPNVRYCCFHYAIIPYYRSLLSADHSKKDEPATPALQKNYGMVILNGIAAQVLEIDRDFFELLQWISNDTSGAIRQSLSDALRDNLIQLGVL